jgi:O-antigen/teichoic acid export membrane protein
MIAQGVLWNTSHLVRAAVGMGVGDGVGNLFVSAPVLIWLPIAHFSGRPVSVTLVFALLALGAGAAILVHLVVMARVLRRRIPGFGSVRARVETRLWTTRSLKLWLSSGLETANQYLDVLIIGYLLSPSVAGAYFVVTRLANAFAAASDSLNLFATRHIPDLYYRRDFDQLGRILNTIAGTTAAVVVIGLVAIAALGFWVLTLVSPAYGEYYPALVVLCVGTAALAAAGPSASFLMLTGHEGRYLAILALTVLLRAAAFVALTPGFGILGAVAATTGSFMVMALALRHATRKLAGIDASLLRLMTPAPSMQG